MQFTPSQQDALNIEKHVCVTAGAGSGKTTVLVERYLKILREGKAKPREIVAITFTNKAAAEMKDRIIERLSPQEENEDLEQSNSLQHFRDEMNSAHISTIHSFCSSILREFPFQARVPANFSILQAIDQKLLLQDTLKKTLKNIATNPDEANRPELTRLLQRYGGEKKLVEILSTMIDKRDIIAKLKQEIYDRYSEAETREYWQQNALIELMSVLDVAEFIRCLNVVLVLASAKNSDMVRDLTQLLEALSAQNPNSLEVLNLLKEIANLIVTGKNDIAKRDFIGLKVETTSIAPEINFLVSAAKKIKDTPSLGSDDDFLISTTRDLLTLYTRILNDYETAKLSQGALDNDDLQLKTRDMLRNNKKIREELVKRHQYYMVDEYQDTNELQHELVMLLTNELKDANLFIVGDPKQSIYGFRGADVRVFKKIKQKITDMGGEDISLTENFRSLRDPIGFVNYFFDYLMGDGSENEFEVQYESLTQTRQVDANGGIEILLGRQDDETANEYTLIAQHIKNMKANSIAGDGHRANESVWPGPIEYDDIAILIRYRTHLPDIEHALLKAGIPYLTTKGVGFYQRQEIYDIWNYLNFLNEPVKNQASLAAVLRGPAFGISDTKLYEISLQEGASFWNKAQNYQAKSDNDLKHAITILKQHCQFANRMPVNQLIVTIVNETGMIGTLKTGIYGQQRLANYKKLLELARNFDGDENTQILPNFIEFLDTLIKEEPREGEAIIEESRGAVKIMTVHAAKGQEFPIVILPCLDRKGRPDSEPFIDEALGIGFSPLNPDEDYKKTEPEIVVLMKNQLNKKGTAEKKRLFYVGATRAEDRLILSGTLSDKGKPQQMLEWIYEHLGIDEEVNPLSLPVSGEVFSGNDTSRQHFQLEIPIYRALTDLAPMSEVSDETPTVEFPEWTRQIPDSTGIHSAFSVPELANYARCPLRYQLENVLRIPSIKQAEPDSDENEMKNAILYVLMQIREPSDTQNLDTRIQQAFENFPEIADAETELRKHINNFLDSELGQMALRASETETNQHIYADVDGHILDGRIDRLFRDETGHWQAIIYRTGDAQHPTVCSPEMELYSLLIHRCYPEQPTVKINIFFTEQGQCEKGHFSTTELAEAAGRWRKKISALQRGIYEKNLKHCSFCPYADTDDQCIVTEP